MLPDTHDHHDDIRISLSQLWVFTHVARTSSITQSAEVLYRAQSAITQNIQKLEAVLGERLFERRPSGVLLTPVGNCIVERANRIFAELQTLSDWCMSHDGRAHGHDRVPPYLLNTRRLYVLVALALSHHMPTAAKAAGVTQTAVSAAIKVLEVGSGLKLFQRNGRGIISTAHGEEFVLRVRLALKELSLIADDISALKGNLRGDVIVGITPLARTLILPKAIARVSVQFPGIRVCTEESPYETINAELRAGKIDFVMTSIRENQETHGLVSELVLHDRLIVVARNGHPFTQRKNISLSDLVSEQWIFPRIYAPTRRLVDGLFTQQNLTPPTPVVESSDSSILRGTLGATNMLALLSSQQLRRDLDSGELTVLDVQLPMTQRAIGLRWRDSPLSPAAQVLMNVIRKVAHEHIESI
jgi:LysR family transcriptional regulator of gallate degradation